MTIDRNDAPEGYEARAEIREASCHGCQLKFRSLDCVQAHCTASFRKDSHSVIFVKRKPHLVATGGRRPTPPEWAKRWRKYQRNGHIGTAYRLDEFPLYSFRCKHTGDASDILFVEWLR